MRKKVNEHMSSANNVIYIMLSEIPTAVFQIVSNIGVIDDGLAGFGG